MTAHGAQILDEMDALEKTLLRKMQLGRRRAWGAFEPRHLENPRPLPPGPSSRQRLLRWRGTTIASALSAPFIYGMAVSFLFMDMCLAAYQAVCFPLYGIPRVRRSDYFVMDRERLPYLNPLEKLNCLYCSYANGVIGYVREIAARTEQYWCPIKHARPQPGADERYAHFLPYGDATNYHRRLEAYRDALRVAGPDPGSAGPLEEGRP